jgi:hypothetical protein
LPRIILRVIIEEEVVDDVIVGATQLAQIRALEAQVGLLVSIGERGSAILTSEAFLEASGDERVDLFAVMSEANKRMFG